MISITSALFTLLLHSSITFLGTYPTEFNDFARTIIALPDMGYLVIGSTDAPDAENTRFIRTDPWGEILESTTPPYSEMCAVLTNDTNIVQTYIYENSLIVQKLTTQNTEIWKKSFPEYSHYFPKEILLCSDHGYLILSAYQYQESSIQSVLKTNASGEVEWETIIPNSAPTAVTQNEFGSFLTTSLTDSGSKVSVLNSAGEVQIEIELSQIILRDIAFINELIVVAAVTDGIICLNEAGDTQWQYLSQDTVEIFSLSETMDNCIIASGSIMENSERRAFLVKLNQDGTEIWQNQFGYGSSFRSIFVQTCSDYGYCLIGGYIENATLNSFVIKTDSEGNLNQQGFESNYNFNEPPSMFEICNPVMNKSVNIQVNNFSQPFLSLIIRDLSGRTIYTQVIQGYTGDTQITVNELHTGTYFVSASTNNSTESMKFVVIR